MSNILARAWIDDFALPLISEGHMLVERMGDHHGVELDEWVILWSWARTWTRPGLDYTDSSLAYQKQTFGELLETMGWGAEYLLEKYGRTLEDLTRQLADQDRALLANSGWHDLVYSNYPVEHELSKRLLAMFKTFF